jgi:L-serine deaminase
MKNDWITMIITFQLGFCTNATIWRFAQNCTEDVGYPLGISIAMAAALICRILSNRSRHNARAMTPATEQDHGK